MEELFWRNWRGWLLQHIFEEQVYHYAAGASHADIVKACEEAVKYSLICEEKITKELLMSYIQDRKALYQYKEA